jgi:serine phosphatase RsbU (regulator of sigma subunit)
VNRGLRILHLEDEPRDAELIEATLVAAGLACEVRLVTGRAEFIAALDQGEWDLVLADFSLPEFDGMSALAIVRNRYPELPFVFVSGRLGEEAAIESLKNGATDYVLKHRLIRLVPAVNRALSEALERTERHKAEEELRESELRRCQMQMELVYAAEVQAKLLPRDFPRLPGFDIAARCLPAQQVGGDFFDWQEVCPGLWSLTLGDVMGKGLAAAMLMATVRASIRAVTQHNRPAKALQLAEFALLPDLDHSDSFVTLFHGQLHAERRTLNFVDCGHGFVFLRRQNGTVEELRPRGLPLGVPGQKIYQEGKIQLEPGDILVIFSDGLIDARPNLELDIPTLARLLDETMSARQIVDRLIGLTEMVEPLPDDVTVLVARCSG